MIVVKLRPRIEYTFGQFCRRAISRQNSAKEWRMCFLKIPFYTLKELLPIIFEILVPPNTINERKVIMRIRFYSIIIIVLAVSSITQAEIINKIGVLLGGGQSFEIGYENKTYSKVSISPAIDLELLGSKYLSIKTIIGYDTKGSNDLNFTLTKNLGVSHDSLVDSLVDEKRKSDYLSLRILMTLKIPLQFFKPYLLLGPRLDYLLKREIEDTWLGAKPVDMTKNTTRLVYGISSGIGTIFNLKNLSISPLILADLDLNKSKAEYGNQYRNFQYLIALELAYNFSK